MSLEINARNRMILELPSEVQMAIRLRAVKSNATTGEVVCEAIQHRFGRDVEEARAALAEKDQPKSAGRKKAD
jgi:hypothetical protein